MNCSSLGVPVSGGVADCLAQAGLDYTVLSTPACFVPKVEVDGEEGIQDVPQHFVTYRADTKQPFGVVKSRYEIIQNSEVYSFLDLVDGLKLTNAGQLKSGGWLCGKFPEQNILGDEYAPYVFFSNSHDGSSRFVISFTPIRTACQTCVNISESGADYHFGVRHTQIANHKIKLAQSFVRQHLEVMKQLKAMAEETVVKKFDFPQIETIFSEVLKSQLGRESRTHMLDLQLLKECYFESDMARFQGTGYGVILAVAKYVTHVLPKKSRNKESIFHNTLFQTNPLLSTARQLVRVA